MSLYIFQFYLSYYYNIYTFSRAHWEVKVEEANKEDQADQCGSEAESEDCTGLSTFWVTGLNGKHDRLEV